MSETRTAGEQTDEEIQQRNQGQITNRDPIAISGRGLACLIANAHRLLRTKYIGRPLWAMVSDLTGHGSTYSANICLQCGYSPAQPCRNKILARSLTNDGRAQ